jgi:hypothetical protein
VAPGLSLRTAPEYEPVLAQLFIEFLNVIDFKVDADFRMTCRTGSMNRKQRAIAGVEKYGFPWFIGRRGLQAESYVPVFAGTQHVCIGDIQNHCAQFWDSHYFLLWNGIVRADTY